MACVVARRAQSLFRPPGNVPGRHNLAVAESFFGLCERNANQPQSGATAIEEYSWQ
jgi:hypothetical protein